MEQKPDPAEGSLNPVPERTRYFKCLPTDTVVPPGAPELPLYVQPPKGDSYELDRWNCEVRWMGTRQLTAAAAKALEQSRQEPAGFAGYHPTLWDRIARGFWSMVNELRAWLT